MRRVEDAAPISLSEVKQLAAGRFGDMVKGVYPDLEGEDFLELDSMINLRPSFGNRSRGVDDAETRTAIAALVARLVQR